MASISIDITLDEIDTDDLIEELEGRYLDSNDVKRILAFLKDVDATKFSLFMNHKDNYSLLELERMFSDESLNVIPSENQIKISF